MMTRRQFLGASAAAAAVTLLPRAARAADAVPVRPQPKIPRWRGFNLTEMAGGRAHGPFKETDFDWMAGWGFNFARIPLSYWQWSSPKDWNTMRPEALLPLDKAVELGRQHGIHTCLALHRAPGYCVNGREFEPYQLFDSPRDSMQRALEASCKHWRFLAERYKDVSNDHVSFDLLNEPPFMPDQSRYVEIAKALISTIRSVSPDRLIFANGADIGQTPVLGLIDEGIVQSAHEYQPKMISHYKAGWVPANEFESLAVPTWPMVDKHGVLWNKEKLRQVDVDVWKPLTDRGAPVHVGEWGCHTFTPHNVCIAWMTDAVSLWKEAGWGWSLWNLRGGFGVIDSGRADVAYEDFKGHKLDRKMLEVLLAG